MRILLLAAVVASVAAPPAPARAWETPAQLCDLPQDTSPKRMLRNLRLAARMAQVETRTLETVGLKDQGARMVPDAQTQAFQLQDDIPLGSFAITVLMFAETPSMLVAAGADTVTSDADVQRLTRQFDVRQLDMARIRVADDAAGRFRTRLGVYIPPIRAAFGPLWPIRLSTFAVIACPKPPGRAPAEPGQVPGQLSGEPPGEPPGERPGERMDAYVLMQDVSDGSAAAIDVVLAVLVLWLLVALACRLGRAGKGQGPRGEARARRGWGWLDPVLITQDSLGFGSTSRLQIFYFTVVLAATLTYVFLRAGYLSEIPSNLLYLVGIVGAGGTLSRVVANARADRDDNITFTTDRWLSRHGIVFPPRTARWWDLVVTGKEFDVYKFQGLVFSLLVGAWILSSGLSNLADLKIPDNIMLLLGLSQAIYVGGKAVAEPSRKGLNDAVARAIRAETALLASILPDHPYHEQARLRGLAFGLGEPPPAQLVPLPDGARAAYDAFRTEATAVLGLANQILGSRVAVVVEPVEPPDDTGGNPAPSATG